MWGWWLNDGRPVRDFGKPSWPNGRTNSWGLRKTTRCRLQVLTKRKIPAQVTKIIFALLYYPGSYKVKITPTIKAYTGKDDKSCIPSRRCVLVALLAGKEPTEPIALKAGWVRHNLLVWRGAEKKPCSCPESNTSCPISVLSLTKC
jgi:hypothetical protein